ncbi:MAG: hypothetical protein LBB07_01840, partial [Bifidobacteriaceae bacterium]|nr:hypothetical protein [Bifidobacteriaceae bacterium]
MKSFIKSNQSYKILIACVLSAALVFSAAVIPKSNAAESGNENRAAESVVNAIGDGTMRLSLTEGQKTEFNQILGSDFDSTPANVYIYAPTCQVTDWNALEVYDDDMGDRWYSSFMLQNCAIGANNILISLNSDHSNPVTF